jgi:hypothetical protein|tara:strand:- start:2826 stop:3581 length:756 start_codon:yes stop_codon:yes gene_type:complete
MDLANKKWLYVVGCSHTAGCEVLTPGDGKLTHAGLQKTWNGLLAKDYKLNLINDSLSGAGNEYIMNSAIDFVSKWKESGRDINELLVIQAWSTFERQQFAWQDKYHIHWANGQDHQQYIDQYKHDFSNYFKALQIYATDHYFGIKRRVRNQVLCKNYFEAEGVDFVMFNGCSVQQEIWEKDNQSKKYNPKSRFNHLMKNLPLDRFFEPYESFIDQYRFDDSKKEHISEWLHADAYLHELYYIKFKTWLETI